MRARRLCPFLPVWLLLAGYLARTASSEPIYCKEGERPQLQRLTETTYDISMYPSEKLNRMVARTCLWEIKLQPEQSGGLLLQMRHRDDRPVHFGNYSIGNLTATMYRNGVNTMEFQWNATVFKYIWMNWTDKLELRFAVDNASAARADNSLYLFASFATSKSCSDGSQLHYNRACYLAYRTNSSHVEVPVELTAGATFETVDELLGFFGHDPALGLLSTDPELLIPGMMLCNGTLMRLIRIDADADGGADGGQCQLYPVEGNVSSVQWANNMTQPSCCKFLALQPSTNALRCVTSDEASQLPALLAVSSFHRRFARQPAPHNSSIDCGSILRPGTVPPGGENYEKLKLAWLAGVLLALLVVALLIGLVYYCCSRRAKKQAPPALLATSNESMEPTWPMAQRRPSYCVICE